MATETTLTSARAWAPDLNTFAPVDVIPDALVLSTSTIAGSVEGDAPSVRVAYVDDAAAGFVAEGADIDEANPDLAEALVHTGKISQLVRLSREQWNQDMTPELLAESVARAVTRAANSAYIAQAAPVSPAVTPPAGLLNVAGILNGGTVLDDLDALADVFTQISENDGTPSHIIASPSAWGYLSKLKFGAAYAAPLLGAGTADTPRVLLGVPVMVTNAVPTDTLLVVDSTAIVSAVGDLQIATSEHVYFGADSIALRATWRFGHAVVHPDRIAKLSTDVGS